MPENSELIARAWRQAAENLRIEVVAPYLVVLPDGDTKEFLVLVKGFGTRNGTLLGLFSRSEADAFRQDSAIAEKAGHGFSQLNPEVYGAYNRETFVDALLDWGWADSEHEPPKWYQEQVRQQSNPASHTPNR